MSQTLDKHPTHSHYKQTTGRPAMFPHIYILMLSVSKGASGTIFLRTLVCRGRERTYNIPSPCGRSTTEPLGPVSPDSYCSQISKHVGEADACFKLRISGDD